MGQKQSKIPTELLEVYEPLTVFSQYEIKQAWRKFEIIHKSYKQANQDFNVEIVDGNNTALVALHLPLEAFTKHFPELKENPFKEELCRYFSESDGALSFEDFLDMVSVLSHNARKDDKILCAFKVYDFDGDDFIGRKDLEKLLDRLCGYNSDVDKQTEAQAVDATERHDVETSTASVGDGKQAQSADKANRLSDEEKKVIIDKIFEESLMSNEEKLCLDDFAHIISKSPDFFKTFRVRI